MDGAAISIGRDAYKTLTAMLNQQKEPFSGEKLTQAWKILCSRLAGGNEKETTSWEDFFLSMHSKHFGELVGKAISDDTLDMIKGKLLSLLWKYGQ